MKEQRSLLLVEPDAACGRVQAVVFRRLGYTVRLVHTRTTALRAIRAAVYDVCVVDLFVAGGGPELARELAGRVRRLVLSVGPSLARAEVLHAAAGFPVHRKVALTRVLRGSREGAPAAGARPPRARRRAR